MLGYIDSNNEIRAQLKPYVKDGEKYKLSGIIEINSCHYREISLYNRSLIKRKIEPKSYIYLDNDNKAVTNKTLLKELTKLAHYYEIFFSDDKVSGMLSALKTEQELKRERNNVKDMGEALEYLYNEQVLSAQPVKNAISKIMTLREKADDTARGLLNSIEDMKHENLNFNEELFNNLNTYREELLKIDFEKIKYLYSINDCFNEVRTEAEKKRKKWGTRIKGNMVGKLIKISDEISYYKRLMTLYDTVLDMNSSQYIKHINSLNEEKINIRLSLVKS